MKRENKKELNSVDNKLMKMIADIRTAVTTADEEFEKVKKEVLDFKLILSELDERKEDKEGVLVIVEESAKKSQKKLD